jgi:transcriptional regulator with XRE-family HTH domain
MLQKKLGRRIAELRRAGKLTQEQLAEALGCSVDFISLVERGVNAPSVAGLADFSRVLKVEVRDLFTFDAGKRPANGGKRR